ncbi:MAG: hypothetical protein QW478_11810 [Candidatus Micrarchaeaceae archaeon]
MNDELIIQNQIYFLRYLSSKYDSDIFVSLTGRSKWLDLYSVVRNPPNFPIASRSILRNELVLEIDDGDWTVVRDGSRRILKLLEKWGARDSFYLSYSGNRSVHIHLFFDLSTVKISDDTLKVLENIDKDEIRKATKAYIMRQIAYATDTNLDMNLAGRHLIRCEGGIHEITNKPCSMIDFIPNDRPANYPVKIPGPDSLPLKLWSINFLEDELNVYLKLHFGKNRKPIYGPGKPISVNPEQLVSVLRPIYIRGFRHFIVLSVSGFLKRHQVPLETALKIIKELAARDEERASRIYNFTQIYKADNRKRLYGLPQLVKIIKKEMEVGKITEQIAKITISQLENIASKDTLKTVYILRDFKTQWHNRVLDFRKEDLLNTDEKLAMHLQSIGVAKILDKEVQT